MQEIKNGIDRTHLYSIFAPLKQNKYERKEKETIQ